VLGRRDSHAFHLEGQKSKEENRHLSFVYHFLLSENQALPRKPGPERRNTPSSELELAWAPRVQYLPPHRYRACWPSLETFLNCPPSGDLEVTVDFLTEVDKLVQLIECPIFTCESPEFRSLSGMAIGLSWPSAGSD
jgi:hypothetical protein